MDGLKKCLFVNRTIKCECVCVCVRRFVCVRTHLHAEGMCGQLIWRLKFEPSFREGRQQEVRRQEVRQQEERGQQEVSSTHRDGVNVKVTKRAHVGEHGGCDSQEVLHLPVGGRAHPVCGGGGMGGRCKAQPAIGVVAGHVGGERPLPASATTTIKSTWRHLWDGGETKV